MLVSGIEPKYQFIINEEHEHYNPYVSLWVHVLANAIYDATWTKERNPKSNQSQRQKYKLLRNKARRWLFRCDRNDVGSLCWLSDAIGIDKNIIRAWATERISKGRSSKLLRKAPYRSYRDVQKALQAAERPRRQNGC